MDSVRPARTNSRRKLLRHSAGVSPSSETCSKVTERGSPYSENKASSLHFHILRIPQLWGWLQLRQRSGSNVLQCSAWLLRVPHLSEGFAFSWGSLHSQHLRHRTIGGSSFDAPGKPSCSFLALLQHMRRQVLHKRSHPSADSW